MIFDSSLYDTFALTFGGSGSFLTGSTVLGTTILNVDLLLD